jgi:hypothetical protein
MDWQDEHRKSVAAFPADVREAHGHSSMHRAEIMASTICGCFYCWHIFPLGDITEWTDDEQTAICPKCGIDSVIGDKSGFEISGQFLTHMKSYWF